MCMCFKCTCVTICFYLLLLRSGAVQKVKCIPILVSLSSFKSSKGREVWGETFMHWMPICKHNIKIFHQLPLSIHVHVCLTD